MLMGRDGVMKELHKLIGKAQKFYDGQVEFLFDDGELQPKQHSARKADENRLSIFFFITPNSGLYKNARIKFCMTVDVTSYPSQAPVITCSNAIYHPNIYWYLKGGHSWETIVCVRGDWELGSGLDGAVLGVLYLLYNPQLDDAMGPARSLRGDYEEFVDNVKRSLRGEDIGGYKYDKLVDDATGMIESEKDVDDGGCYADENRTDDALMDTSESVEVSVISRVLSVTPPTTEEITPISQLPHSNIEDEASVYSTESPLTMPITTTNTTGELPLTTNIHSPITPFENLSDNNVSFVAPADAVKFYEPRILRSHLKLKTTHRTTGKVLGRKGAMQENTGALRWTLRKRRRAELGPYYNTK